MSVQHTQYKHLKFAEFLNLTFWDYYNFNSKNKLETNFEIVKLKSVLKQRKQNITIDDQVIYKLCRVKINAKGVVLRAEMKGEDIKTKKQQLCKTNDFLVAEIDAKVGGYGIVPPELENAIVSSHYFLFEIDEKKLLPEFLGLIIKLKQFSEQIKATGSTNYAAIRPYQVLEYQIPLPSLKQQQQLVGSFNKKMFKSEDYLNEIIYLNNQIEEYINDILGIKKTINNKKIGLNFIDSSKLRRWDIEFLLGKTQNLESKYPLVPFGSLIISIKNGISARNYSEDGLRFLTVTDIKNNNISEQDVKFIDKYKDSDIITPSTLLITRKGTVGQSYFHENGKVSASSEIFIIKLDETKVNGNYFSEINLLDFIKNQYKEKYTGTIMPSMSQDKLKEILMPLPDLRIQRQIVKEIFARKSKINNLQENSLKLIDSAFEELETNLFIK